ncbi:MAG: VIT1/CCC1 transporter family protein [Thermoplasmata archaeon]
MGKDQAAVVHQGAVSKLTGDDVVALAKRNIEEGERWHKKINVREIVFGFNDGSISTLALLAGVTGGALTHGQAIVAGISGVVAGATSMGIGAYISSKSEIEHHMSEIERERREIESIPEVEREEILQIYRKKAPFTEEELATIVGRITSDKDVWLDSMMKEELGLFEERFEKPSKLALVMFAAFLTGGLVPVIPFLVLNVPLTALVVASAVTFLSLFAIGVWKTTFTHKSWWKSGSEMVFIGVLATVIPYLIGDLLLPEVLAALTW